MSTFTRYGWFGFAGLLLLVAVGLQGREPAGGALIAGLAGTLAACAGLITQNPRTGIVASAALAFGANAYLFGRKIDGASNPSMCNVSEAVNCDVVNNSAASEMFGYPITLFGMGLYMGIAIAGMQKERNSPKFSQITGLIAAASLVYCVWLAYQATLIGAVCVVCITIYIATALLLWAAVRDLKRAELPLFAGFGELPMSSSALTIATTFVVVAMVGGSSWSNTAGAQGGSAALNLSKPDQLAKLYSTTTGPVNLHDNEPILGDPNAPLIVIGWADYLCPHCARADREMESLVKEFPNLLQFRFKTYPLDGDCNPYIDFDNDGPPTRCQAAHAAKCAHRQDKFWELSTMMFANQRDLSLDTIAKMVGEIGLDAAAFDECMNDPTAFEELRLDTMQGGAAGVTGTPALFMKGIAGDDFVEILGGPAAVYKIIQARESGVTLPPPGPPREG